MLENVACSNLLHHIGPKLAKAQHADLAQRCWIPLVVPRRENVFYTDGICILRLFEGTCILVLVVHAFKIKSSTALLHII